MDPEINSREADPQNQLVNTGKNERLATYAEARGGCIYFDQVLSLTKAPDGSRLAGNEADLFGKLVVNWEEADYSLLEQSYFSAFGSARGT
ncbi:MAG: hypothetical protein ACOZAM_09510 [Pseudomonadota bacterium]